MVLHLAPYAKIILLLHTPLFVAFFWFQDDGEEMITLISRKKTGIK